MKPSLRWLRRGPAFRAALVLALPCFAAVLGSGESVAQVPAPRDVFGFEPGDDYRLADYEQIVRYFDALDASSDRIVVERIGESTLNRPLLLALISSPENLDNRELYRLYSQRLATAQGLRDDEAQRLARDGKAIVWVDGGLHATEVAHGQFTPVFAHWLVTDESEEARRIRDQAIVLLMPNMNPDGLDIVVDWYRSVIGTPYETANPPELYHHYIGHDNNRDWYMFTQAETKAVARQLYHVWYPQIVYNHHQSGPFPGRIWVPPFENPVNPNLDPLVVASINQIGESMKKRFAAEGKPGVSSGIVYDMWWNGSMRGAPDFHNMLGFLTETALYRYATPHCYEASDVPEYFNARAGNLPAQRPTTHYIEPWRGGCWHLKDPIAYMMTATRAVADLAARLKDEYLYNIYLMGRRQIARGERAEGGPFAYVIDLDRQHDAGAAVEMLRVFRTAGIDIVRAEREFAADGRVYPQGTYVIGPQAFRPFVIDLMEPKQFPDRRQYPDGPPDPPYDMTGYELRLQMGITADRVTTTFDMPGGLIDEIPNAPGGVSGDGQWGFLVRPEANALAIGVNRVLEIGAEVLRSGREFRTGSDRWPAGTVAIRNISSDTADRLGRELGLRFEAQDRAPDAAWTRVTAPRVGLYESYVANMPAGWTRWLLENYEFQFRTLRDEDIRSGSLDAFDVIIVPDQATQRIVNGHRPGTMPERFTGGLGDEGVARLREFVAGGGWLYAIDEAADFAIDAFELPVRNVVVDLPSTDFFIPGSLIHLEVDTSDPIGAGMPEQAIAFFVRSQVFELTSADANVDVFARYPPADYLASGWAHGAERYLANGVAGLHVGVGDGRVVLIGFEPHFRGQPHNTYKLLFNVLFASSSQ